MDKKILDQQILTLFNSPFTKNKGFNLLVDSYKQPLYFQIRRILISHESTNDVLQEVFIKCWNKLDSFNQQSKLSTWLYRIAYNESLQWIRKNDKHNSYSLDEINQNHTPSTSIFAKNACEISLILEKAVLSLPEKQRIVFQYKYFENLEYKEIQEITGGSIGGLKASYHHAVAKVKKYLTMN